jgi:oxygen-dependent protoporphyrinogen oxidase
MQRLVDALVEGMSSVQFVAHRVTAMRPAPKGGWLLEPCVQHYDAVVVATSAPEAARMLATEGLTALDSMPTASVVLLTAALKGVDLPPRLNGFLVPRNSGRLMTACSFGSNKWPHWGGPATAVVRISAGRYGESEVLELDDATLVDRLLDELRDALGVDFSCVATRISRYPYSFPQYFPEHGSVVSKVEAFLETSSPGVYLAGSSYRGIGVPACIASGRGAARLARQSVMART